MHVMVDQTSCLPHRRVSYQKELLPDTLLTFWTKVYPEEIASRYTFAFPTRIRTSTGKSESPTAHTMQDRAKRTIADDRLPHIVVRNELERVWATAYRTTVVRSDSERAFGIVYRTTVVRNDKTVL